MSMGKTKPNISTTANVDQSIITTAPHKTKYIFHNERLLTEHRPPHYEINPQFVLDFLILNY